MSVDRYSAIRGYADEMSRMVSEKLISNLTAEGSIALYAKFLCDWDKSPTSEGAVFQNGLSRYRELQEKGDA